MAFLPFLIIVLPQPFFNQKGALVCQPNQIKTTKSFATGQFWRPPWGRPALPLAARALGVGYWDGTSSSVALLLTACMTDIVFDDLCHMTFCMGKMTFFLVKILSVNKTLAGCARVCLSATPCTSLQQNFLVKTLGSQPL